MRWPGKFFAKDVVNVVKGRMKGEWVLTRIMEYNLPTDNFIQ